MVFFSALLYPPIVGMRELDQIYIPPPLEAVELSEIILAVIVVGRPPINIPPPTSAVLPETVLSPVIVNMPLFTIPPP